tara:strand:- start:1357 stop:1653 length:297 start_codon:yes stop_codon:yes gene_type:complete
MDLAESGGRLPTEIEDGRSKVNGFIKAVRGWYKQSLSNNDHYTRKRNEDCYLAAKTHLENNGYKIKEFEASRTISVQRNWVQIKDEDGTIKYEQEIAA